MPQNTWFQGLKLLFPRLETLVPPWGNFSSISRKLKFLAFECTVLDLVDNFACYT